MRNFTERVKNRWSRVAFGEDDGEINECSQRVVPVLCTGFCIGKPSDERGGDYDNNDDERGRDSAARTYI